MSGALETLLGSARADGRCLFLNARMHADLPQDVHVQQYFKVYAAALERDGFKVSPDIPDDVYDSVWLLAPKNAIEAQYMMARAAQVLREGGTLYVAADNDAGGRRLAGWMTALGFDDVHSESRNKARVCWAEKGQVDLDAALKAGAVQDILEGRFVSQPGVFGWDKIDRGSDILTQNLPKDLSGVGADFGCGYGYLSDYLLQHNSGIERLYAFDADYRATLLCARNVAARCDWRDLTLAQPDINALDFIVMNPPFHEGKAQDVSVGQAFIETASKSLEKGGELWMVANVHLPYERGLQSCFVQVDKVYEGQGFKVLRAVL